MSRGYHGSQVAPVTHQRQTGRTSQTQQQQKQINPVYIASSVITDANYIPQMSPPQVEKVLTHIRSHTHTQARILSHIHASLACILTLMLCRMSKRVERCQIRRRLAMIMTHQHIHRRNSHLALLSHTCPLLFRGSWMLPGIDAVRSVWSQRRGLCNNSNKNVI